MAVRVSFREVPHSARLENYLTTELDTLLPSKGFFGDLTCDVIVRMHNGPQNRGVDVYSCSIRLHGNKKFEKVTVAKGERVDVAVRLAIAKFERVLGKEHERLVHPPRIRSDDRGEDRGEGRGTVRADAFVDVEALNMP